MSEIYYKERVNVAVGRTQNYNGTGPLTPLVNGDADSPDRLAAFAAVAQVQAIEDLQKAVEELAKRNAQNMTQLISAIGDLTKSVDALRENINSLGEDGIKARLDAEVQKASAIAVQTLGALR